MVQRLESRRLANHHKTSGRRGLLLVKYAANILDFRFSQSHLLLHYRGLGSFNIRPAETVL